MNKAGLIFDMDGVVVDNDRFHYLAWMEFSEKYGFNVSFREVKSWFGSVNGEILKGLFKRELNPVEIEKMAGEKEEIYRNIYEKDICEVKGLGEFLKNLDKNKYTVALATSAPPKNVEFVLRKTALKDEFSVIVDDSHIKNGKPDPEIFLKAAERIGIDPSHCVVFEDSFHGIEAATRAGMKVIGVATTHNEEDLYGTELVIKDFSSLSVLNIEKILNKLKTK